MKSVCVYCGSRQGLDSHLTTMAYQVGESLAKAGYTVIYGGASAGLMGQVANGALSRSGNVIGVIPKVISSFETVHNSLTKAYAVESMHDRKLKMVQLADAFIALPGGFGTLDELNEVITWKQIKLHDKPIAILNHNGYYDLYLDFLKNATQSGLISQQHIDMLIVEKDINAIIHKFSK